MGGGQLPPLATSLIVSAWWLRTSSKFTWEEVNWKMVNSLSGSGFVQRIAPPSLSRERRIKIIGVARIFEYKSPSHESRAMMSLQFFDEGLSWDKDSVEWIIRSRDMRWRLTRILLQEEDVNQKKTFQTCLNWKTGE